jgi:glutamate/tyrosine decarboxylase-like PLP-dependent enzyme
MLEMGVNTITMSFWKFFGVSPTCGLVLTTKDFMSEL